LLRSLSPPVSAPSPVKARRRCSATAAAAVQPAQSAERRGKGAVTKCYRDFVVGNYACHAYRTW